MAAQLRFVVFDERTVLRRVVHELKADVVGRWGPVRRGEDEVTSALDRAHAAQVLGEARANGKRLA